MCVVLLIRLRRDTTTADWRTKCAMSAVVLRTREVRQVTLRFILGGFPANGVWSPESSPSDMVKVICVKHNKSAAHNTRRAADRKILSSLLPWGAVCDPDLRNHEPRAI